MEESVEKLSNFCAYQERCQWEVRRKLFEKGIHGNDSESLILEMVNAGFINEERYARAFARGKFKLKKWGRTRIRRELKMREISPKSIEIGLSEIDPVEYYDVLLVQAERQWEKIAEKELYKKRFKIGQYLMGRGFEQDLVKEAIEEVSKEDVD
jgi:regulatory protein